MSRRGQRQPQAWFSQETVRCRWQVCSPFPANPAEGVPTHAALVARPGHFRPAQASHSPLPRRRQALLRHQEAVARHDCHFKVSTRQGQGEQLGSGTAVAPSPSFLVRTVIQVPSFRCPHLRYLSPALPATCPHELSCKGPACHDDFQVPPASTPGGSDLMLSWS